MRIRTLSIKILVMVFSSLLIAPDCFAQKKQIGAWQFTATSSNFGKLKGSTTSNAIMVSNGVFKFLIREPYFGSLRIINPENKSYTQTTVAAHALKWTEARRYPPLKKVGVGKYLGLNCQHYKYEGRNSIDAWYSNSLVSKKLGNSVSQLCGLPVGYGMPLKIHCTWHSKTVPLFRILKIEKTRISQNSLQVPMNYRLIKDQALFYFSNEDGTNSGIDEFFRTPISGKRKK